MICLIRLEHRGHSTLIGGEAFRGGQRSAGSFGLIADSASVAQQRAVEATMTEEIDQKKKEKGGDRQRRERKKKTK